MYLTLISVDDGRTRDGIPLRDLFLIAHESLAEGSEGRLVVFQGDVTYAEAKARQDLCARAGLTFCEVAGHPPGRPSRVNRGLRVPAAEPAEADGQPGDDGRRGAGGA